MKTLFCTVTFLVGVIALAVFNSNPGSLPEESKELSPNYPTAERTLNDLFTPDVTMSEFGMTKSGQEVHLFTCTNENGLVMKMINYGAIMTSLEVPDRNGKMTNITLDCDDIAGYEACRSYFGATVGRFCNRIANGKFEIDGEAFSLATNNDPNHLHGGDIGFDKVVWRAEKIEGDDRVGVRFSYTSVDGEEGYPGQLTVTAEYILTNQNEMIVDLQAETDQDTHVNLTNHNYWNLAGSGAITDHQLKIEADNYLPTNETLIPTGEISAVKDTLFDFTQFREMGDRLDEVGDSDPRGFDLCYALNNQDGSLKLAATVKEPATGRSMEVWTTQPGLQFYTGNFLDGTAGSGGFDQHHGFCLETQHYPDSPNQPTFPSTLLKAGENYRHTTVHKFSTFDE